MKNELNFENCKLLLVLVPLAICICPDRIFANPEYKHGPYPEYKGFTLAECDEIEDVVEGAKCVIQYKDGGKPQRDLPNVGKWEIREEISLLDGSKDIYMNLGAEWKKEYRYLSVFCERNVTVAYLNIHEDLQVTGRRGDELFTNVLVALDGKNLRVDTLSWDRTTHSLDIPKPIRFIKSLMGKSELVVELLRNNSTKVVARFDVARTAEAMKPLRKACHW